MRMEDLYTRLLVAILLIGCFIAILPWWLILIIVSPILYVGFKLWWKIRQIKKMTNNSQNPFGSGQNPFGDMFGGQNPFGGGQNPFGDQQGNSQSNTQKTSQNTTSGKSTANKKVFTDEDGEYVDFEEVK